MTMETTNTFSEEIIIVGSRYGELAGVLNPLYKEGRPMEEEEITRMLGGDMVLLHPTQNRYDQYAVGVYTLSQKLLGYVWMYQSPSIRDWLDDNHKEYMKAHIRQVNTKYGFMMATPDKPVKLKYRERTSFSIDPDWASNIPEVLPSITEQSLSLGIALLRDELEEAEAWSGSLQKRIDNLLRNLPLDLSAHRYMESMELYEMMKNSPIAQVREQSMLVLQSLVVRGSKDQMTWWMKHWLPDFFRDAAEGDLLGIYEAANYTLERVEGLLNGSPENLFYLFKVNRERFAYHLYYSQLPQPVYNRLLTLLAVREAMLKKGAKGSDPFVPSVPVVNSIKRLKDEGLLLHLYDYTWVMEVMNQTKDLPKFNTPASFISYLKSHGIKRLPSETSIYKKQNTFTGIFPLWEFTDCDTTEAARRINIGKRFMNLYREEFGIIPRIVQ